VKKAAGLSDKVMAETGRAPGDGAVSHWFAGREVSKRAAE
jgi:hypothetical protein